MHVHGRYTATVIRKRFTLILRLCFTFEAGRMPRFILAPPLRSNLPRHPSRLLSPYFFIYTSVIVREFTTR